MGKHLIKLDTNSSIQDMKRLKNATRPIVAAYSENGGGGKILSKLNN